MSDFGKDVNFCIEKLYDLNVKMESISAQRIHPGNQWMIMTSVKQTKLCHGILFIRRHHDTDI